MLRQLPLTHAGIVELKKIKTFQYSPLYYITIFITTHILIENKLHLLVCSKYISIGQVLMTMSYFQLHNVILGLGQF